jgi:DNA-binding response OmpR family regulator
MLPYNSVKSRGVMSKKIFLFHWNQTEAAEKAEILSDAGWDVACESSDGARGCKSLKADSPTVVVIDLNRLPSHGRETALYLKSTKATSEIPIVFVDGEPETIAKIKAIIPDATYTTSKKLNSILTKLAGK